MLKKLTVILGFAMMAAPIVTLLAITLGWSVTLIVGSCIASMIVGFLLIEWGD